jgi:hypothetical protein
MGFPHDVAGSKTSVLQGQWRAEMRPAALGFPSTGPMMPNII